MATYTSRFVQLTDYCLLEYMYTNGLATAAAYPFTNGNSSQSSACVLNNGSYFTNLGLVGII